MSPADPGPHGARAGGPERSDRALHRRHGVDAPRPGWIVASVIAIVVMMTWTVVVKVLVPLAWFWSERFAGHEPAAVPVMWDLWPLAHVVLAVALWRRTPWARAYGLLVAVVESAIVITKLGLYLKSPDLGLWGLLWLSNKIYVLALFLCLGYVLLGPGNAAFRLPASADRGRR